MTSVDFIHVLQLIFTVLLQKTFVYKTSYKLEKNLTQKHDSKSETLRYLYKLD